MSASYVIVYTASPSHLLRRAGNPAFFNPRSVQHAETVPASFGFCVITRLFVYRLLPNNPKNLLFRPYSLGGSVSRALPSIIFPGLVVMIFSAFPWSSHLYVSSIASLIYGPLFPREWASVPSTCPIL